MNDTVKRAKPRLDRRERPRHLFRGGHIRLQYQNFSPLILQRGKRLQLTRQLAVWSCCYGALPILTRGHGAARDEGEPGPCGPHQPCRHFKADAARAAGDGIDAAFAQTTRQRFRHIGLGARQPLHHPLAAAPGDEVVGAVGCHFAKECRGKTLGGAVIEIDNLNNRPRTFARQHAGDTSEGGAFGMDQRFSANGLCARCDEEQAPARAATVLQRSRKGPCAIEPPAAAGSSIHCPERHDTVRHAAGVLECAQQGLAGLPVIGIDGMVAGPSAVGVYTDDNAAFGLNIVFEGCRRFGTVAE